MRASITSNAGEIRSRMLSRAAAVASELRRENVGIAKDLTAESQRLLQSDIYGIPEKVSRTGRKLWVRKGTLKAGDRWVAVGMAVVHKNPAPHAPFRSRYGKPGGRPASPPQKASYWVRNAVLGMGRSIQVRRRAAIRRAWQRTG